MFFKRFGLQDWLMQRLTALYLALYFLYLIVFFVSHNPLDYSAWQALFQCQIMKVATFIAFLALIAHAWIGMWTITTDYLKNNCVRISIQALVILALLGYGFWGVLILWGTHSI
jgi:succinate dehydrogenase / fumarate reductase membrane anchor subunit